MTNRERAAEIAGVFRIAAAGACLVPFYPGRDLHRPGDLVMPGLILLFSAATAVLVVRFARRHAGEIGEARFDTRNRDAR